MLLIIWLARAHVDIGRLSERIGFRVDVRVRVVIPRAAERQDAMRNVRVTTTDRRCERTTSLKTN